MAAKKNNSNIAAAQDVTTGTPIRFETAKSSRKPKPNPALAAAHEINPVGGFMAFLRDYAVVGLAVGFIIGLQAQNLVKQLVASFIDPAFNLLFGQALSQRTFTMEWHDRTSDFPWGAFVYVLLNFLFVIAVIYAIVKILKLDRLDKPKKKEIDKMRELK